MHSTSGSSTTPTKDETKLRQVLVANATTSGLGGITAVLFAHMVADLIGTDRTGWVRVIGAGLVAFAAFVVVTARSSTDHLRRVTPLISVGDLAWVVGTVTTTALGWYSTLGGFVMAIVAAMVGSFGIAQLAFVRRVAQTTESAPPAGVS